jgi:translation initiation factor 6 (eIF-6)
MEVRKMTRRTITIPTSLEKLIIKGQAKAMDIAEKDVSFTTVANWVLTAGVLAISNNRLTDDDWKMVKDILDEEQELNQAGVIDCIGNLYLEKMGLR